MSLFEPTVPRSLYDALQARYDDLLERYHALRVMGQYAPKPGVVHKPALEPETVAERRLVDSVAVELTDHLTRLPGVTREMAEAEAERIRREAFSPFGDPPLS